MLKEINQIRLRISKTQSIEKLDMLYKIMFKKEEAVYEQCGYPDLFLHKACHDEFIRTITSAQDQIRTHKLTRKDLLEYIKLWTKRHEEVNDRISMAFVRTKQLIGETS